MLRFARECSTTSQEILSVAPPFSNFDFIDSRFLEVGPIRRVFSQVRATNGKTMVVEELDPAEAQDLAEETEDLQKRLQTTVSSKVCRLSFFTKSFSTVKGLSSASDEDFIGYAIIRTDIPASGEPISRVYESVVRPSPRENSFVRGAQEWECCVGKQTFRVQGYLYAQQNQKTNSCAHVACRTAAARFHPNGDMTYREMNSLPQIGVDHVTNVSGGLTNDQIVAVLEAAGARCTVADYTSPNPLNPNFTPPPFQKYLYGSVESGYPAIVFFAAGGGDYHAIPIFGHTFDEDMWVANAELSYFSVGASTKYIPSESWLSTYIGHDDNWGSNFSIPRHFLYTKSHCDKWPSGPQPCVSQSDCVAYVIATMPKEVMLNPIEAEVIGAEYLLSILPQMPPLSPLWAKRLEAYAKSHLLVLRPILLDCSRYSDHLAKLNDWDGHHIPRALVKAIKRISPSLMWVIELSVPELFSANRRKIGEVLLHAERKPGTQRDFDSFLLARVPGYFAFHTGGTKANPQFTFVPTGVHGHVPLWACEG